MAYGAFLLDARGQGTSHAPGLTIREIRAVRLRDGFNSRFVRVYTKQGLTGTGEMLDTVGAEYIVNNNIGPALAGHRVVLNLWAYWCGPCAVELPAMTEYQRRVGSAVMVVTVHQDENEEAALLRLAELGVRLPTLQDGGRRVAAALRVPNVMPATVVLNSDGSVAKTLPRAFATADEITDAIGRQDARRGRP